MKTITAVNLVKKGIKDGLSNDQIRSQPQFVKLLQQHNYRVNDRQIDNLRKSQAERPE